MIRPAAVLLIACVSTAHAVDDPFARWTFDTSNGVDVTGHAHDVVAFGGVQFVTGRSGLSASLDGSTGWLDRAADAGFTPGADSWTTYAWILTKTTGQAGTVIGWYRCGANPGCGSPDAAAYVLNVQSDNKPAFWLRDDAAGQVLVAGPTAVTDGRWHLLVGTYDAATDLGSLYVDGVSVASSTVALGPVTSGSVSIPLTIGRQFRQGWASPTDYFKGVVDDVRLYRRALAASEVLALYNAGVVGAANPEPVFALGPATPNPARALSSVHASLASPAHVSVDVFDASGRRVRHLFDGPRDAGAFTVSWDGGIEGGGPAAPGVYFYRLETQGADGEASRTTKVALIR